jgi:ABC-type bacteriocin/lantibiotic exporter with double-glycine peptidase domain
MVVVVCFFLVFAQRGVNVLVPIQAGLITNKLSGDYGPVVIPWKEICLYILYRMLQGANGLLGSIRSTLWIPINQYAYRELSIASFEHVHSLSYDFHVGKKTGEVLSALGKGNSINTFLDQITFQVAPMIIDLTVALFYFGIVFDAYYVLVVTLVTATYIYVTLVLAKQRADARRTANKMDREIDGTK